MSKDKDIQELEDRIAKLETQYSGLWDFNVQQLRINEGLLKSVRSVKEYADNIVKAIEKGRS